MHAQLSQALWVPRARVTLACVNDRLFSFAFGVLVACVGCGDAAAVAPSSAASSSSSGGAGGGGAATLAVVEVVLFTHIEDQSPVGELGSAPSKASYLGLRGALIEVATFAKARKLSWVLQPDWKYLEAARLYEDDALKASTNGKNLFVHLRDDLGVAIDPHSHEKGGYNYTDVAHLLELLGVGGSTVIGGHIWDPSLPEFAEWDRFRVPLAGMKFPAALWRGDILIGAGTPNHVNDPLVSGAWRPQDRDHYFDDAPAGNIVAFGAWHDQLAGVEELVALYADGTVKPGQMLTASWNIGPSAIVAKDGPSTIDATVFEPLAALVAKGLVESTDFTSLTQRWQTDFGGQATIYKP